MAKGKHAVMAANRRYEASVEHIDRLTSELVEAKARARQYHADAERLPATLAEVARLREQVNAGTSDELEKLRAHSAEIVEHAEATTKEALTILNAIAKRVVAHDPDTPFLTVEEQDWLSAHKAAWVIDDGSANRQLRRARMTGHTADRMGAWNVQDNGRTHDDNIAKRMGEAV